MNDAAMHGQPAHGTEQRIDEQKQPSAPGMHQYRGAAHTKAPVSPQITGVLSQRSRNTGTQVPSKTQVECSVGTRAGESRNPVVKQTNQRVVGNLGRLYNQRYVHVATGNATVTNWCVVNRVTLS